MSAINFYLGRGETPYTKSVVLSGGGTHAVWSPQAGKRVVITDLSISSIDAAGTIAFYFDNGNDRIAQYFLGASASIFPTIGSWQSTVTSGRIFAARTAIQTDGIFINVSGFEVQ